MLKDIVQKIRRTVEKGGQDMDQLSSNTSHTSPFDSIRHTDEDGNEYWSARELGKVLGYATNYRNFQQVIQKAEEACKNSGQVVSDHIANVRNMIKVGKGAQREVDDVHLARYACSLAVQNANSSKPLVALGQAYFAVQTRRQEVADEMIELPEDQLRLLRRSQMNIYNTQLAEAARSSGVVQLFKVKVLSVNMIPCGGGSQLGSGATTRLRNISRSWL